MKTVDSGRELSAELNKVAGMLDDDFAKILQKLAFDAFRELVTRTARDSGFARSNWAVSVDTTPAESVLKNPGGFHRAPQAPSLTVKGNSIVTIYNNTEYIIYLEEGTPRMRAQPMVEPTYHMLTGIARRLADQLSKRAYDV